MVMSIKKKIAMEMKVPSARVQFGVLGKKMWLWVDSGSPMTIFSMTDLKSALGKNKLTFTTNTRRIFGLQQQQLNTHAGEDSSDDGIQWLSFTGSDVSICGEPSIDPWAQFDGHPRTGTGSKRMSHGN